MACDFCCSDEVITKIYQAKDFSISITASGVDETVITSEGAWAACKTCSFLVRDGQQVGPDEKKHRENAQISKICHTSYDRATDAERVLGQSSPRREWSGPPEPRAGCVLDVATERPGGSEKMIASRLPDKTLCLYAGIGWTTPAGDSAAPTTGNSLKYREKINPQLRSDIFSRFP